VVPLAFLPLSKAFHVAICFLNLMHMFMTLCFNVIQKIYNKADFHDGLVCVFNAQACCHMFQ